MVVRWKKDYSFFFKSELTFPEICCCRTKFTVIIKGMIKIIKKKQKKRSYISRVMLLSHKVQSHNQSMIKLAPPLRLEATRVPRAHHRL